MQQRCDSPILRQQIREELSKSLPKGEELVTRREFFERSVRSVVPPTVAGIELQLLSLPAVAVAAERKALAAPKQERTRREQEHAAKVEHVKTTSIIHTTPNGSVLHNRGVIHLGPLLASRSHYESLRRDFEAADIVLLESEQVIGSKTHKRLAHGYFAQLRRMALELKKPVYDIDIKHSPVDFDAVAATTALASAGGIGGLYALERYRNVQLPLRGFLRLIGWTAALSSQFSPPFLLHLIRGAQGYPASDLGWTIDGRTVLMLGHTKEFLEKNPGKRILVVTGDLHAQGFEYYLEHPRIFSCKHAIYRNTYFKGLSGPPERVTEVGTTSSRAK